MHGWDSVLKDWPDHSLSYNRAPTSEVAAFRGETGELMRWGMIPSWSKEFKSNFATFNARVETVAEKPTFRNAWAKSHRCLIPMAGYYEWRGEKGSKQPVYITDRNSGVIVVAGLYEQWGSNGQLSCTMLTTAADQELAPIHPRMPIMLTQESAREWLAGSKDVTAFKRPSLIYYPVSKAVGNVRNNSPELITPVSD